MGYRTLAATGRILGVSAQRVLEFIEHGPLVGRTMPEGLMVHDEDLREFRRPLGFATSSDTTEQRGSDLSQGVASCCAEPLSAGNHSSIIGLCGDVIEEWLPVVGSDRHEVSSLGRLRTWKVGRWGARLDAPKIIAPREISEGYLGFSRGSYLHVEILRAFVGPAPEGHEAAHRDGDPHNNALSNLRWATHAENIADKMRHGTCSARKKPNLCPEDVAEIQRRRESGERRASIAADFNCTRQTVTKATARHLRLVTNS